MFREDAKVASNRKYLLINVYCGYQRCRTPDSLKNRTKVSEKQKIILLWEKYSLFISPKEKIYLFSKFFLPHRGRCREATEGFYSQT